MDGASCFNSVDKLVSCGTNCCNEIFSRRISFDITSHVEGVRLSLNHLIKRSSKSTYFIFFPAPFSLFRWFPKMKIVSVHVIERSNKDRLWKLMNFY